LSLRSDDLVSIGELYTEDDFRQLVVAIEISIDEQSDLALYIASEKPKAFAHLRGGYGARVGEPVVAVGFPLSGLLSSDPTLNFGIKRRG
jgi:hypothetical protein